MLLNFIPTKNNDCSLFGELLSFTISLHISISVQVPIHLAKTSWTPHTSWESW